MSTIQCHAHRITETHVKIVVRQSNRTPYVSKETYQSDVKIYSLVRYSSAFREPSFPRKEQPLPQNFLDWNEVLIGSFSFKTKNNVLPKPNSPLALGNRALWPLTSRDRSERQMENPAALFLQETLPLHVVVQPIEQCSFLLQVFVRKNFYFLLSWFEGWQKFPQASRLTRSKLVHKAS